MAARFYPHDLAALRRDHDANLPDRATISRMPTDGTASESGDTTLTPSTIATNVPCRLSVLSGDEVIVGTQMVARGRRMLRFKRGQDVLERDRLTIALTGPPAATVVVDVAHVLAPHTHEIGRRVLVDLVGS